MNRLLTGILIAAILLPGPLLAAGPQRLALSDRSLWPYDFSSPDRFDLASRFEIAAFSAALDNYFAENKDLGEALGLSDINESSVRDWTELTRQRLLQNFRHASASCRGDIALLCPTVPIADWTQLARLLPGSTLSPELSDWRDSALRFYADYIYEQLRLAALHPRISSEIAGLDPQEILGYEFPDRHFLLTFDDGPTQAGGNTDKLVHILRSERVSASFFMLGERLQQRLEQQPAAVVSQLYAGMCPASHAFVHKSHAKLADWQDSVARTRELLVQTFPEQTSDALAFRPPYGQRLPEAAALLAPQGQRIVLWNIDSQDWHKKIDAGQTADRVMTLMLLWRRGIILFHDVMPKAQSAIPQLVGMSRSAGVTWMDCHQLTKGSMIAAAR
ncbi:MAG: polysaccharide deacetylase family protein [Pseudomonadota bacterium]